ncbi:MAG: hypothetical protein RMX59_035150 [Nostoc sp. DedSLP05]|nr:hypothetical protein [Nostoc sp. DedSLP05]MDZ8102083.1 hypothetical protein [Nostoc sp. DedSLP01]
MSLTFEDLAAKLPAGSVEFVGNNQVKINFSQLTGDSINLQSSCVKGVVRLMQGLAALTDQENEDRAAVNPPLTPIEFASQTLQGTPQQPEYLFEVAVKVNTANFVDNLVDPTA